MQKYLPLVFLMLAACSAHARNWTNTLGKNVDAEVISVNADRTVVLKTRRGKTVKVPFNTFIEEDVKYLNHLLARKGRGKLHSVPWDELNTLFGLNIWQDDFLWDDKTGATAERMKLKKESKTAFMENYRAYPLGKKKILTEPVFATALYGGTECVASISLVFLNQGDMSLPDSGFISPHALKQMAQQIEESVMRVHAALSTKLGEPKRDMLGKGDMREKVWRWDWNQHAIMLTTAEGKYGALRIMPTERADRSGRIKKIKEAELKKRLASCVERRDNGDVVIKNIPMINQGPKGYCSPATWERYLRYMEIPVDMYLLALAGNTGVGGGTSSRAMLAATKSLISANGRELEPVHEQPSPAQVAEYIDQGLPLMWRLLSTPSFQQAANANTARRAGKKPKIKKAGQTEDSNAGGHICLIVGYNLKTDEIAISDSWGPRFAERWVKTADIQRVSNGYMNLIKW